MALPKQNLTLEQLKARSALWVQRWRTKYPEKQALARKRAYINRKTRAFKLLGEVKCNKCGCGELSFLEFNHIDGGGCKDYKNAKNEPMMDRLLRNKRDTKGLEILCRVCNALDYLSRKNKEQSQRYEIKFK